MPGYFSRLNYSFGNEDWTAEKRALQIRPKDRVLCITASGDRPLHVLLDDPGQVIAVDGNASQNHLLELKRAALRTLPFEHYLSFLGGSPEDSRLSRFPAVASAMHPSAANYWTKRPKTIAKGVLFQGALERNCVYFSRFLQLLRGPMIRDLFSIHDLSQQRQFVKERWDRKPWRMLFSTLMHPSIMRVFAFDPGLYRYVDNQLHPGKYFYQRMTESLHRCLARKNPFLSLIFTGTVKPEAYAPYLTKADAEVIQAHLDRLSIHTSDVIPFLEASPESSFDRFSLSDIASYIPQATFVRLLRAVLRAGKPGSRFCIRQFLSSHEIPADLKPHFQREPDLEKKLGQEDICFWARFAVGTIKK